MRNLRGKLNQNVIFFATFFKICFLKLIFSSRTCILESFFPQNHAFLKYISFFKNRRVVKFLIQNLTRCRKVDSKSDKMKKFYFKIMLFTKTFSFKIMLFRKNFTFKIMLFRKIFSSKSCSLKLHVIRKKCTIYRVN